MFLTVNPMPCSLTSSDDLPCQNRVKSLSLTDPVSGSLVSWRTTMSICSLLRSPSMTAVLRASFTSCRLSEKPGVIVLTVHVPNFRAGVFIFLFPGAQLSIHLVFTLNATHPVRLTDSGRAAPHWLGTAQLKAGGSCPVRCDDLSHRLKQPLASDSTPTELQTYNLDCYFPRFVDAAKRSWSDISRAQSLGK